MHVLDLRPPRAPGSHAVVEGESGLVGDNPRPQREEKDDDDGSRQEYRTGRHELNPPGVSGGSVT
jgi:hypothetical protein